jgi:hypothetical protein
MKNIVMDGFRKKMTKRLSGFSPAPDEGAGNSDERVVGIAMRKS